MHYDKNDRIERQDFLEGFGFQASTESRARKQGLPWPPYVVLGKKIYYSRQSVQQWFEEQEAKTASAAVDDLTAEATVGGEAAGAAVDDLMDVTVGGETP
jgi:hypothetical protein